MQEQRDDPFGDDSDAPAPRPIPSDIRIVRDIAYGPDEQQRFDVYLPKQARNAPVIFLVHGGGWARGDKNAHTVVDNKVAHWVPKGFIVVSTNYRMLPKTTPLEQAKDVANAIAAAQQKAQGWGGDRGKFVLMGHSAGAHLVALLAAAPHLSDGLVITPWLGTIVLDSAALDLVQTMQARHMRLYDRAFGRDPEQWKAASPYHALNKKGAPILVVCSSRRSDSCPQAERFVTQAATFGTQASVLQQDLSHRDINQRLGEERAYTASVETFMRSLDLAVARLLIQRLAPPRDAPQDSKLSPK